DLQDFAGQSDVLVAMVFWGQYSIWGYPTGQMYDFVRSLGAGPALDRWASWSHSAQYQTCAYAIAGVPGWATGQAQEQYAGVQAWVFRHLPEPDYPGLELQVFLEPQSLGNALLYSPT